MADVDPVTGYPTEGRPIMTERYARLNERKAKADQLEESLSSEIGQTVLNKIKEHLLQRVNKLMDEDPECRVLKKVLMDMALTINVGENAVEGLMRVIMKKSYGK